MPKRSPKLVTWTPSDEQQCICDFILQGDNVAVDACAGSGKSTTILSVAIQNPHKKFLVITYNAMLRKEFREKVAEYGISNIEVHTYHSFTVKYYSREGHTDTGIRRFLYGEEEREAEGGAEVVAEVVAEGGEGEAETAPPVAGFGVVLDYTPVPAYDVVVLDEAQDMTFLYYRLVTRILDSIVGMKPGGKRPRGRPHKVQLLVLGDYMQGLYEFKGADTRFLTLAPQVWAGCPHLRSPMFHTCTLRTSYRITRHMASFVNQVMLGCDDPEQTRLRACRDGPVVVYLRQSQSRMELIVVNLIDRILDGGDLPSDIFVLGGSVKSANSNIRKIENALVSRGIPCHVPMLEAEKIDDRVINGKVVFSTFHSVKGRQRKYVFIVGFDQSYFDFYGRNLDPMECPNTLYVGCTRATHQLFLLENSDWSTDRPLDFLAMTHHQMKAADFVEFRGETQSITYARATLSPAELAKKVETHMVSVTKLIEFIKEAILEKITPMVDRMFVTVRPAAEVTDSESMIPSVVPFQNGMCEDVADLTGIALPCLYWDRIQRARVGDPSYNGLYQLIGGMIANLKTNEHQFLKETFRAIDPADATPAAYLYLANIYKAVEEKLYFKVKQIPREEYGWLPDEVVETVIDQMAVTIGCEEVEKHEHEIIHTKMEAEHGPMDRVLKAVPGLGVTPGGTPIQYRFTARVDMITAGTLWELKCTQQITMDHLLQVVVYGWLWRMLNPGSDKKVRIYNIKTGEVMELRATDDELTAVVVELLRGKYETAETLTDEKFLQQFEPLKV